MPSVLTSVSLYAALALGPAGAEAGAAPATAAPATAAPAPSESKQLYDQGKVAFDTAEYDAALVAWVRAFKLTPPGPANRAIRSALALNIAEAHKRAYEVSRNPAHLHAGRQLLDARKLELQQGYPQDPTLPDELAKIDERIAELDKLIAESQARGEQLAPLPANMQPFGPLEPNPAQPPPQAQPQPPPQPVVLSPKAQWEQDVANDPVLGPKWERSKKRIGGGAAMLGIGGGFAPISISLIVVGVNTDPLADVFGLRRAMIATGVVFGVASLGLITGGAVVLAKGISERNEVYDAKPRPVASVAPLMLPGGGGVGVVGRF